MKAAQIKAKNERYTIVDVPKPRPGKGQLLLKIHAAGFCHTDIMVSHGDFDSPFPITGSHEPAGEVVEIGEDVEGFGIGDRVIALNHAENCGKCYECRHETDQTICIDGKFSGLHVDGPFSEYFPVLATRSAKIPDSLSYEKAAPLTCAGVTMYGAIKKANLPKGSILAISGLGALGHIGVQMAKAMGYFVVGIDARAEPIELCKGFKNAPDVLIDASQTKAEQGVEEITRAAAAAGISADREPGVDAVLLTSEGQSAVQYALDVTRRHGTLVLISQPPELRIPFKYIVFKDIRIVGSLQGGQRELQETVDLVQEQGIEVVTRSWRLQNINKMWESQESKGMVGKNVVLFE